jgi:hypothetical protein
MRILKKKLSENIVLGVYYLSEIMTRMSVYRNITRLKENY